MKKLDFFIQTLLILAAIVALVMTAMDKGNFLFFLMVQFVVGCWQMASSLLSVIFRGSLFKQKLWHFTIAIVYLFSLVLVDQYSSHAMLWSLYVTIPAWMLGVYYYGLSWKAAMRTKSDKGNFLPNLSF